MKHMRLICLGLLVVLGGCGKGTPSQQVANESDAKQGSIRCTTMSEFVTVEGTHF